MSAAQGGATPTRSGVAGLVLAAGGSRRMGRAKQLIPVRGRPLLCHTVEAALDSHLDEVVVVLGHRAADVRGALAPQETPRLRCVENPAWEEGQSGSLRAGLAALAPDTAAAAVLLGDQPVPAHVIDRVLDAFHACRRAAARPVFADGVPGHPVVFARSLFAALAGLTGDRGARTLLDERPDLLAEIPLPGAHPPDADTPRDVARLDESLDPARIHRDS